MFLSSCEYIAVQEQLAVLLGTTSRISIASIATFAANTNTNTNTETAYKQFCQDLSSWAPEDLIQKHGDEIREILKSQGMIASSQIASDTGDVLETAYEEYCEDLYRVGFTVDMLPPKDKILQVLRSRGVVASSQSGGRDKGQLGCSLRTYVQPLTYKQIVLLVHQPCLHLG